MDLLNVNKKIFCGPVRDSNPGPLAPKARIIPLDQLANLITTGIYKSFVELKRLQNVYGINGEAYQVSLFTSSIEGAGYTRM